MMRHHADAAHEERHRGQREPTAKIAPKSWSNVSLMRSCSTR
jgi:hypothetical protein